MEGTLKYSRLSKELMMKELETKFKKHPNFIISKYTKLSASDINLLRRNVKKIKSEYFVIKNTLASKVIENLDRKDLASTVEGNCGITFIGGDAVEAAKIILNFAKDHEQFNVRAGVIEGSTIDAEGLKRLASLPSREVLLTMVVSTMQAPISGFVNVLAALPRSFLYALKAVKDQKEKENK